VEGEAIENVGLIHDAEEELAINLRKSPRNPYGTHASLGYPGVRDAWKRAWRVYFSQWGGGKTTATAMGSLRGTQRRIAMIAKGMKPPCDIPMEVTSKRDGPKSPLAGEFKQIPSDYGLSRWKKPSDDGLTQEDVQFTCQDLKDLKRMCMEEINRRIADREAEEASNQEDDMPYPNEHAARITDPDQYDDIRRQNDKFGKGIHAIWGIKEGQDEPELQAIHFDAEMFTPDEARAWLKEHKYEPIEFEEATGEEVATEQDFYRRVIDVLKSAFKKMQSENDQEVNAMDELIAKLAEDERLNLSADELSGLEENVLKVIAALLDKLATDEEPEVNEPEEETVQPEAEQPAAEPSPEAVNAAPCAEEVRALQARLAVLEAKVSAPEATRKAELVQDLAGNEANAFSQK
jgi:hypothetical protein